MYWVALIDYLYTKTSRKPYIASLTRTLWKRTKPQEATTEKQKLLLELGQSLREGEIKRRNKTKHQGVMALGSEPSHTKKRLETSVNKHIEAKKSLSHELGKAVSCCNVFWLVCRIAVEIVIVASQSNSLFHFLQHRIGLEGTPSFCICDDKRGNVLLIYVALDGRWSLTLQNTFQRCLECSLSYNHDHIKHRQHKSG